LKFDNAVTRIARVLANISVALLAIMLFLGVADVLGRYIFNRPVTGTLEVFEILLPGIVMLSVAYTQLNKAHIRVELLFNRLSPRLQAAISFATSLWLTILFVLVAWQGTLIAISLWRQHRLISIIGVPVFTVQLFIPFGALIMCLILIVDLRKFLTDMKAEFRKGH